MGEGITANGEKEGRLCVLGQKMADKYFPRKGDGRRCKKPSQAPLDGARVLLDIQLIRFTYFFPQALG